MIPHIQAKRLTLITRRDPHDYDILSVLLILVRCDQLHDLIIDDTSIRIIDSTVTADQQLWPFVFAKFVGRRLEKFAELGV